MKKIVIKINGMHCVSCAINIDGELEDTKGIKNSTTNYAKQETEVEFDPSSIKESQIQEIIQKLGYQTHLNS